VSDKPLDCVGFELGAARIGKHDFRATPANTQNDWQSAVHSGRDDLTGFVRWVKANPELDEPVKKLVSALAADYNRKRSR